MSWIPLHVHSQYSILDSTASVTALADKAKSYGLSHLALTDQGNLYGAVDFYKACKAAKVQPILGCELWMAPGSRKERQKPPGSPAGFPFIVLVKNAKGYQNLCKLSSMGYIEGFYYTPRIDRDSLIAHAEGLICFSGARLAWLIGQGKEAEAEQEIFFHRGLFGNDYYFELQRQATSAMVDESWLAQAHREYGEQQEKVNAKLVQLSKEFEVPCVATQSIHYLEREDWQAHEILLNIQSGETSEIWERDSRGNLKTKVPNPKRKVAQSRELYFRSPEEMKSLFSDLPEALEESVRIAEKCQFVLDFQTKHYPVFVPPSGGKASDFLRELCEQAIPKRYTPSHLAEVEKKVPGRDPLQVVRERFEYEYHLLTSKGLVDYLLIVYDFINWAKQRGIPVGPGRGSAAGSIISYLTGITDIEPLRFQLFFERFINPERISYPDIDVDICMQRRQEVIDYTVGKYGKDKVAQIITFGTMKAKMAIRDVGRVLNIPLPKVNEIASLIPEEPNMTIEKALELDSQLRDLKENDEEARRLLEIAQKAEGSIRNTSTHAAGLIISESSLTDHIPICHAKDSEMLVTQYAMKPVESIGMLKIDFLGLKTLTSLQKCVDALGKTVDWTNLPLNDRKTFDLLSHGKTEGVFQLESGGMTDLVKQLQVDSFEEIIAVVALYRPGPMELIPSFIERKHGREAIEIDHPLMKEILAETYGIMVYQEQVMQIASVLAGYSLGEGDVLRRAMGKKDKEEMSRQREKFQKGAVAKGIDADTASRIFDKIDKFASYGFNKSHAAAYAYLSYATAYFKANAPKEWMAALMTCDLDDLTQVAKWISECKALHIPVLPPHINHSGSEFVATPDGIRFAMSGIKGVGRGVVDLIIKERLAKGPYEGLYDNVKRLYIAKVGKKTTEILIDAGAFDGMGWSRDAMRESLDAMVAHASREQKESSLGVLNLFSLIEEQDNPFAAPPPVLNPTTRRDHLLKEKELLGFYLTGHPLDECGAKIEQLAVTPIDQLSDATLYRIAAIIESADIKISNKSQRKFAILHLSDKSGRLELPVWSDMYDEKQALLKEGQLIYAVIQGEKRGGDLLQYSCRLIGDLTTLSEEEVDACDRLKPLEAKRKSAPEKPSPLLRLELDADRVRHSDILALKKAFRAHPGKSPIELLFLVKGRRHSALAIDPSWGVTLGRDLHSHLEPILSRLGARFTVVDG